MNLKTVLESFLSAHIAPFIFIFCSTLSLAQPVVETPQSYTITPPATEINLPKPSEVGVFFDSEVLVPEYAFQPGQAIPITYYNLSDLKETNPKVNEALAKLKLSPQDMEKMLNDTIGKGLPIFEIDVMGDTKKAYDGAKKLEDYRIDKIPAIVFDGGKSVVLGVTDVGEALRRYGEWRKGRDI